MEAMVEINALRWTVLLYYCLQELFVVCALLHQGN